MSYDPQNATGRTMPARIPVAPRPAPAATVPVTSVAPAPAAPAAESSTAPAYPSAGQSGPVEGAGSPTPAVAPVPFQAPFPSAAPIQASGPVTTTQAYPSAAAVPGVSASASVAAAPPLARYGSLPVEPTTTEERTMLYVLRLVDQVLCPGTLSPVERAFIAGAKVMFDHLSMECEGMLNRKVTDLTGLMPNLAEAPLTAASTAPEGSPKTARPSRKAPKRTRKAKPDQELKA